MSLPFGPEGEKLNGAEVHNAAARHLKAPLTPTRNWPITVEAMASTSSKAGRHQANPGESSRHLRVRGWAVGVIRKGMEREEKEEAPSEH